MLSPYKTGRLMEHILHTPGFTQEFSDFVIIDEADYQLGRRSGLSARCVWVRVCVCVCFCVCVCVCVQSGQMLHASLFRPSQIVQGTHAHTHTHA